ncbi:hypothetical protein KHM19_23260 [Leptospira borgpetersenii]|nr:hypothetical protein KHM09_23990 [Leptospira borgpetersenii]GIM23143.1 hypothetical protein KHM19_23260 [Leptospira borgpetersenii]GIM26452.1 hypothetical protein KHM25_23770 [Leptospira borgpetersenii]
MSLDFKFKEGFFGKNENATNPLNRFRACPKTYLRAILNKMKANASWNKAV